MHYSRRTLLKNTGLVTLGAAVLRPTTALSKAGQPLFPNGYPDRQAIINAAIDAAVATGASYADARLSHTENLYVKGRYNRRNENMAFGVRALYQGYWGFAASPIWSTEEAARLGAAAVNQAKANALGRTRITELVPMTNLSSGHWEQPIKDDPFRMHPDELSDFQLGYEDYIQKFKFWNGKDGGFQYARVSKAFGSSLNQFTTQVLYSTGGTYLFILKDQRGRKSSAIVEGISPAGQGFEYLRDRPIREYAQKAHEEAMRDLELPDKPTEPGKYNILIDQSGVGKLLSKSIGVATEIDRVFGLEANVGGTSYITEPETMLGTFKIGSPLLNVTCDRSHSGSIGCIQWDDEGVKPVAYDLVKDGLLVNLQTNREGTSWIKEYYIRSGQTLQSFGSASAPSALDVQLVHQGDLSLTPSPGSDSYDDLRTSLGDGIELRFPEPVLDFQQTTGSTMYGRSYEIKKGKRVAKLDKAGMLFRTSELWSNLTGVGGPETVQYNGLLSEFKGQPVQQMWSGVYVPPATFKEMTIVDLKRKA